MTLLIDSHCHVNFEELKAEFPQIASRMRDNGVYRALCVSVDLREWDDMMAMVEREPVLYGTVGVHPDYEDTLEPDIEDLVQRSKHPKVVAIGETGLDYFRLEGDLEWQRERFRVHIRAAKQAGLPLVIHTRQAREDTVRILKEENAADVGGVMHCFTETLEMAKDCIDLGFYISFSGILTFKSAKELQETAKALPLDRILVETDSPYLAPVPFRGKRNDPSLVRHVAEMLATLKGVPLETVARQTTDNFFKLFNKIKEKPNLKN